MVGMSLKPSFVHIIAPATQNEKGEHVIQKLIVWNLRSPIDINNTSFNSAEQVYKERADDIKGPHCQIRFRSHEASGPAEQAPHEGSNVTFNSLRSIISLLRSACGIILFIPCFSSLSATRYRISVGQVSGPPNISSTEDSTTPQNEARCVGV